MARLLTDDQHAYLVSIIKGRRVSEVADMLNNRYGLSLTATQIRYYTKNHNLKSGIDTTFKKGNVPVNKGVKGVYNVGGSSTSFKKGMVPHNYKPIGTERVDRDGYILVKVSDTGAYQKRWKLKHRLIYEAAHGSIPKGYRLLFLDQNKHNLDLDNLVLVSGRQLVILNKKGWVHGDADLTRAGVTLGEIFARTRDLEKGVRWYD